LEGMLVLFFLPTSLILKKRVDLWYLVAVCVCLRIPPIVARQRLGKNPLSFARKRLGEYTCNNRIVGRVVFNVALVVSRKTGD
jgi:hypothetical protein